MFRTCFCTRLATTSHSCPGNLMLAAARDRVTCFRFEAFLLHAQCGRCVSSECEARSARAVSAESCCGQWKMKRMCTKRPFCKIDKIDKSKVVEGGKRRGRAEILNSLAFANNRNKVRCLATIGEVRCDSSTFAPSSLHLSCAAPNHTRARSADCAHSDKRHIHLRRVSESTPPSWPAM